MKRSWIPRVAMALLALAALAYGLTWGRPMLVAAWDRWEKGAEAAVPEAEAPEEPALVWVDDGWCGLHHQPREECTGDPNAVSEGSPCYREVPLVHLATRDTARKIGVETVTVVEELHADTLVGNAEIAYDEHLYAEVTPRVDGLVHAVIGEHGQEVKQGDVLAVVDSAEVGAAKATYLGALPVMQLAESTLERTRSLTQADALPMKDELEAKAMLNRARADILNATQRLKNLGFTQADLDRIDKEKDTSSLLKVVSPIEGLVVEFHAVAGEAVTSSHVLYTISDIRTMWAWIDVYENQIDRVKPGQQVTYEIGGVTDYLSVGDVEWIDSAVNPATRTIRVLAQVANPDYRLRANQFGRAEIQVSEFHSGLFLPKSALQEVNGDHVVFLPESDGQTFRPQHIQIEERENLRDVVEVTWGLEEGQEVVTTGAYLLRQTMLEDAAGALPGVGG